MNKIMFFGWEIQLDQSDFKTFTSDNELLIQDRQDRMIVFSAIFNNESFNIKDCEAAYIDLEVFSIQKLIKLSKSEDSPSIPLEVDGGFTMISEF